MPSIEPIFTSLTINPLERNVGLRGTSSFKPPKTRNSLLGRYIYQENGHISGDI